MPATDAEAAAISQKFYGMNPGFPNIIRCIDGTHVKIQAPTEGEQEYVNRTNFHSISVQIITACLILHNFARSSNIDLPPDNIDLPPDAPEDDVHRGPEVNAQGEVDEQANPQAHDPTERRRRAAGQLVRQRFIEQYFTVA